MTRAAARLAAAALLCAAAAAGCGLGPGESEEGTATLTVTRDFGAEEIASGTLEDPTPSDTVVRFLDQHTEIETDYGDNFVSAIEGIEGSTIDGGDADWFFFVNGIYAEIGAGETEVNSGDRIWWDHRVWGGAYRIPAVVGSFPEPFLHGYEGERRPVVVQCLTADPAPCDTAEESLAEAGVEAEADSPPRPLEQPDSIRVLVGPWAALREDPAVRQLEDGPEVSGVYAEAESCGDTWALTLLAEDDSPRAVTDGGLVAAVRSGADEPTWVVTGGSDAAVADAADLLSEDALADRYAVATSAEGEPLPVPAAVGDPVVEGGCP